MKLLNIKAITKGKMLLEHYDNIRYIQGLSKDEGVQGVHTFNYGRIVGIQEERARRKREKYNGVVLTDDAFIELFELIHKVVEQVSSEELEKFFDCFMKNVEQGIQKDMSPHARQILKSIMQVEACIRKEAFN